MFLQPASPATETCVAGSLWQAASLQVDVVLWRNALKYTGLNQLLDKPTPGQVLVLVPDSGLFSCQGDGDISCQLRQKDWYAQLTTPRGVGLLLLHWLPAPAESAIRNASAATGGVQSLLPTKLNATTATSGDRRTWQIAYTAAPRGGQAKLSLVNSTANTTLGGGATASIMRVISTCGNGTLVVLDRPLVPQAQPEATVNTLSGLENFCWSNGWRQSSLPLALPDSSPCLW